MRSPRIQFETGFDRWKCSGRGVSGHWVHSSHLFYFICAEVMSKHLLLTKALGKALAVGTTETMSREQAGERKPQHPPGAALTHPTEHYINNSNLRLIQKR